tara:strand:- start:1203 stop:2822 length:1620 start_codon:yes stop_codon:yes gene_type:complete
MAKIPKVTVTFDADLDSLKKGVKGATTEVDSFGTKVGDFSKKAALAFAAVAAAAGAMAIKIGVDAVKAASDLSETISKVNVLFGDTAKDIEKFADGAAASLGQTKQQALDAAATFATFGRAAGLSGKDLSGFSTGFVKLASDLASFNNTSPEQAINAIGSALRGEAEPLRAYGVLLDDASLRQAALELGIVSTTKNALTPQQKVLAAQALIYKQTSAAQGDFERTSDGLANKTRILTAQLENAKVTIGEALLPIVLELATLFSDKVIPIVQQVADAFGSNADGMGGTLNTLADGIKGFVQPIFEGFKSAFDKIKATVIENKDEFKAFFDVVKAAAPIIGTVIGKAFSIIGDIASVVLNVFANVVGALKGLINTAIDLANIAIRAANIVKPGADISPISKIGTSSFATSGAPGAISGGKITGGGTTGGTTGGIVGGTTGGTTANTILNEAASTVTKAAVATKAIAGAFTDSQNAARLAAQAGGGFTDSQNAARLAAQGGITINVNAPSIIDEEGFSRAATNALNNSTFRGTNGASNLVYL